MVLIFYIGTFIGISLSRLSGWMWRVLNTRLWCKMKMGRVHCWLLSMCFFCEVIFRYFVVFINSIQLKLISMINNLDKGNKVEVLWSSRLKRCGNQSSVSFLWNENWVKSAQLLKILSVVPNICRTDYFTVWFYRSQWKEVIAVHCRLHTSSETES